jgi:hypothetical protein
LLRLRLRNDDETTDDSTGTSTAAALPCRVMVDGSPRSAAASSADKDAFASRTCTIFMIDPLRG